MAKGKVILPYSNKETWDGWETQMALRDVQGQPQPGWGQVSLGITSFMGRAHETHQSYTWWEMANRVASGHLDRGQVGSQRTFLWNSCPTTMRDTNTVPTPWYHVGENVEEVDCNFELIKYLLEAERTWKHLNCKRWKYSGFSLFVVIMFCNVTANNGLMNTKAFLPGKYRVRFLRASDHNIFNY